MHPLPDVRLVPSCSPLGAAGRRAVPPLRPLACLLWGLSFSAGCSLGTSYSEEQSHTTNIAGASGLGGDGPGAGGAAGSGGQPGLGGSAPIAGAPGVGGSTSPPQPTGEIAAHSASPPQPTGEIATRHVDQLRELTASLLRDPLDSEQE